MKKKFGDRYPKYKTWPSYEQNLYYRITKYQDVDNNKDIAHYFRDLLIDIYNDYILEFELFYTKLEKFHILISQIQSFESLTINNSLVDNFFKH